MTEAIRAWLISFAAWGDEVIIWAQSLSTPFLDGLANFVSFLGEEQFFFVLLPLVYWCFDKKTGRRLAYGLLLSIYSNSLIKHVFMIPRPSDPRIRVMRPVDPPNPSFPSGHAQNGVALWGFLASQTRKAAGWVVTAMLALLISFSRIYLGVHDPLAVIGGLASGVIFLALFLWLLPQVEKSLGQRSTGPKLALAVVLPVAGLLLHQADMRGLYPAPDAATVTGALLGMSVGFVLEPRWISFRVDGPWWQRMFRLILGLVTVAIFWLGPKLLLPEEIAHSTAMALRFLRYAASGLAAILLVPWLFVKLRLARQSNETGD